MRQKTAGTMFAGQEQLSDKLQMLVGAYVQLEGAYCLLNVREAIQIAESIEVHVLYLA